MGPDSTYVRTWAGFSYVAFIVDVFAQKIVALATPARSKDGPACGSRYGWRLWQCDRDRPHPVVGTVTLIRHLPDLPGHCS